MLFQRITHLNIETVDSIFTRGYTLATKILKNRNTVRKITDNKNKSRIINAAFERNHKKWGSSGNDKQVTRQARKKEKKREKRRKKEFSDVLKPLLILF